MKKKKVEPTVTYSTSAYEATSSNDFHNINITASSKVKPSTMDDHPWTPYYLTSDDFFDILKVAFDDTYGSDHRWHPEDLYINVSCVLEIVSNTLANMVRIKAGRELYGVKEG
jgi:hypothetical protein